MDHAPATGSQPAELKRLDVPSTIESAKYREICNTMPVADEPDRANAGAGPTSTRNGADTGPAPHPFTGSTANQCKPSINPVTVAAA